MLTAVSCAVVPEALHFRYACKSRGFLLRYEEELSHH